MQTMQQRRAAFALEQVQKAKGKVKDDEFKSQASSLPAMIHMNGLGQAAAFFCSKGNEKPPKGYDENTHQALFDILSGWLREPGQPFHGHAGLLEGITGSDMEAYLLAQAEAQALMDWVKKFAKALMADENGQGEGAP